MSHKISLFCLFIILFNSANGQPLIFGHRGCRGLLPENTIPAFQRALELNVDGIELDVVVNKDKQLVVSHEPYFKKEFCLDSTGNEIKNERQFNIYTLSQQEIRKFDCGSRGNSEYPEQKGFPVSKPLLQEVFEQLNLKDKILLLEVKSEEKEYGVSQPMPKEFAQLVLNETKKMPSDVVTYFMSFDAQLLQELYRLDNSIKTVYLTYSPLKSARQLLNEIGLKPNILGMFYPTISKREINFLKKKSISVFAWTVNSMETAKKLISKGVTGIITDYPDKIHKR